MTAAERMSERAWFAFFRLAAVTGVCILVLTVAALSRGFSIIDAGFLTRQWQHRDIVSGGIIQAIVGSAILGIGVAVTAFPLGLITAIYLVEYGKGSFWSRMISIAIRNLAGVPSVVYGLFGLAVFVQAMHFGASLLAATATLSLMALPWMVTSSIEALGVVPRAFRESSLALGASRWQTVRHAVIPAALPGCITGGILGVARTLGETAPIMLVGATFFLSGMPTSPSDRFMALPYHTFILATLHTSPSATTYASATALVLILITIILSSGAIIARFILRRRREW